MQVSRWGRSLAVRLPASVVKRLGLQEGDDVSIEIGSQRGASSARSNIRRLALQRLRQLDWTLPPGLAFRRDPGRPGEG